MLGGESKVHRDVLVGNAPPSQVVRLLAGEERQLPDAERGGRIEGKALSPVVSPSSI